MCLVQGHNAVTLVRLELESNIRPLSHWAELPYNLMLNLNCIFRDSIKWILSKIYLICNKFATLYFKIQLLSTYFELFTDLLKYLSLETTMTLTDHDMKTTRLKCGYIDVGSLDIMEPPEGYLMLI